MINNDLKLDYYYIDTLRTILVRVDEKTIHSKHMCNCRVPEESLQYQYKDFSPSKNGFH